MQLPEVITLFAKAVGFIRVQVKFETLRFFWRRQNFVLNSYKRGIGPKSFFVLSSSLDLLLFRARDNVLTIPKYFEGVCKYTSNLLGMA